MALNLAQDVRYIDTKGHTKVAKVVGTPDSVVEGTDLPTLNEGHYTVIIFSPSGRVYGKHSVPDSDDEAVNLSEYTNEDGALIGVLAAL